MSSTTHSTANYLKIFYILLALTIVEVTIVYLHLPKLLLVGLLMILAVWKAALVAMHFMHLKFERMSFILTVVPVLVVLLCLFYIFFPDSTRVDKLRSHPAVKEVRE